MSRCGCSSVCACSVTAGTNIVVTGNGSQINPYVVSAPAGGEPIAAAHIANPTDAHDASAISFIPTGSISATDVQAAIAEVAAEAVTSTSTFNIRTSTVNTTLDASDSVVLLDGTSITGTLPTPVGIPGRVYNVKNINASAATLATVAGTIDGVATKPIAQYNSYTVISDNVNWRVI